MSVRLFAVLLPFALFLSHSAHAKELPPLASAEQMISECEQKSGENRFHLHRCLLQKYEILQKRTDYLTDKLLGIVGENRSLGRWKIIRWSSAISKSHSLWQKLVPQDCEWEAHILPSLKGGSVAIDRCGIKRTAERVQLLENRVKTLDTILKDNKQKEK